MDIYLNSVFFTSNYTCVHFMIQPSFFLQGLLQKLYSAFPFCQSLKQQLSTLQLMFSEFTYTSLETCIYIPGLIFGYRYYQLIPL